MNWLNFIYMSFILYVRKIIFHKDNHVRSNIKEETLDFFKN